MRRFSALLLFGLCFLFGNLEAHAASVHAKPQTHPQNKSHSTKQAPVTTRTGQPKDGTGIVQQISSCMEISAHEGKDMDEVKKLLLTQMRKQAVTSLFSRVYSNPASKVSQNKFTPDYDEAVAEQLRILGQPTYYNGKIFGQLCVKAYVSLPQEMMASVVPKSVSLRSFCYQDDALTGHDLEKKAKLAAVEKLLANSSPGVPVRDSYKREILDKASVSGTTSPDDEHTYCLDIVAQLVPLQVEQFTKKKPKPKTDALKKEKATLGPDWTIDLHAYHQGDLVPQIGKDVAVFTDTEGKYLAANARGGALAQFDLTTSENFTCSVYIKKMYTLEFKHSLKLDILTLHYKNGTFEPFSFKLALDDNDQPIAYFRSWNYSTDYSPWLSADNFNEYRVVKNGKSVKFFYNGNFLFNFETKGDTLIAAKIPLQWNDRLYNLVIKDSGAAQGGAGKPVITWGIPFPAPPAQEKSSSSEDTSESKAAQPQ